jgi:hypothetical protein
MTLPLQLDIFTEIGFERRVHRNPDAGYFPALKLYHYFIPAIAQIEKSIPAICGNCLAHKQATGFGVKKHLESGHRRSACLAFVNFDIAKEDVPAGLRRDSASKKKDDEQ